MPRIKSNVNWQWVEPRGGWQSLPSNREGGFMSIRSEIESVRGELGAMYLQGLNDLHNAIVPAFPDSQHGVQQLGTPLNPTSQMVTRDIEPAGQDAVRDVEPPTVEAPSPEAASYSMESDRAYEAMLDQAASVHQEQELELERE